MLSLNDREWREFKISDVFIVSGSITTKPQQLKQNGIVPRITCASNNNGIDGFYKNKATECGKVLTVDSATIGSIFYQSVDFIATDHVEKLSLKSGEMNREVGLFLKIAIDKSKSNKFDYGYKFSQTRIKRQVIKLPINKNGKPDFDFMEAFVKEREITKRNEYLEYCKKQIGKIRGGGTNNCIYKTENGTWKEFFLGGENGVFKILSGKRLTTADMDTGNIPFVGATDSNNGITNWVKTTNSTLDSNVLGVNYNGSVAEAFYHHYNCIFSDDVKRLHLRTGIDNQYVLLFIATVIKMQKIKYTYGYKFNTTRMARQIIKLPVDHQGKIDFDFMECFAKNVMIKKYNSYIEYCIANNKF